MVVKVRAWVFQECPPSIPPEAGGKYGSPTVQTGGVTQSGCFIRGALCQDPNLIPLENRAYLIWKERRADGFADKAVKAGLARPI